MSKPKSTKQQSKKSTESKQSTKETSQLTADDTIRQARPGILSILLLAVVIGGLTFSAAYGGAKSTETAAEPIPKVLAAVNSEISATQTTDSTPSDEDDSVLTASTDVKPAPTSAPVAASDTTVRSSVSQSPSQPAAAAPPTPATNNAAPDSGHVTEEPSEPDHPGTGLNLDRIIGHLPVEALLRIKL